MNRPKIILFVLPCLFYAALLFPEADKRALEIQKLVSKGVVVLKDVDGQTLFQHKTTERIVPASIQKILLSQLAIRYLGLDYRFKTSFFVDSQNRLYIQGMGDPFLVSEEIVLIAEQLKKLGVTRFAALVLDDSLFEDEKLPGLSNSSRPHDSLNGALIVNFNTVLVEKDKQGRVLQGEPQTPLTSTALEFGKRLKKGTKRRKNLGNDFTQNLKYAHELFLAIFAKNGLSFSDDAFYRGIIPKNLKPNYIHFNSRNLENILQGLLEFSNNYIANQIMLVMGAEVNGYPTNLKKGLDSLNQLMRAVYGFKKNEVILAEASGISRENRISLGAMLKVLDFFRPYAYLMTSEGNAIFKSGTLKGIYNYAGYFQMEKGLRPFILHTVSKSNHRDRVLLLLRGINDSRPL